MHVLPQVAIYAGRGAKRQMSAGRIKQIISRMRPLLRQEKYGDALEVSFSYFAIEMLLAGP